MNLFRFIVPLLLAAAAFGQNVSHGPVTKVTSGANKDQIVEDVKFGTGRTESFLAGSTLSIAGVLNGTPTGGTLNLSALTLTLGGTLASKGFTSGAALDSVGAAQSGTAQNLTTSASPTFAGLTLTGGVTFGAAASAAGTATTDANYGLVLRGKAGAIADVAITRDDGAIILRNDVGTNNLITTGNVAIGATSSISAVRTATAALDFPSTGSGAVADLTITVTGAAVGDTVMLGVPNAAVTATSSFSAWVSSANTVTVRFSPKATENPASGTFRVTVMSF